MVIAEAGPWRLSHRFDSAALRLADQHYNRQKPGTPQFVPPGRCLVLLSNRALWVTSWPYAEYTKHQWAGAWINSCFRREDGPMASELIRAAVAVTRWYWGAPPRVPSIVGPVGIVTFIDRSKVRRKRDYGRCYRKAGWQVIGETRGGLLALGLQTCRFPEPVMPIYGQLKFRWEVSA